MKYFKVLSSVLLLAIAVSAQEPGYNYNKPAPPATPRGTYLPPTTARPFRPEQQEQIAAEGISPDGEHEPGMPFDFTYAVKDDVGNDFSHNAESNGDVVKGEYRTLLPDGRLQIVKYTADWKNGYNAEVTYEGEANYPEPPPRTPAPFRPETDTNIDSQGLAPPKRPQSPPPRPQTQPPRQTPRPTNPPPPPPRQTPRPAPRPTNPPPQRTTQPPPPPPGLYGAPSVPFGVRNNPKFGYSRK